MAAGEAVEPGTQATARDRLTATALAEIDTGRLVDHQVVCAWANSVHTPSAQEAPRAAAPPAP